MDIDKEAYRLLYSCTLLSSPIKAAKHTVKVIEDGRGGMNEGREYFHSIVCKIIEAEENVLAPLRYLNKSYTDDDWHQVLIELELMLRDEASDEKT